jgi:hypothetical protein
MKRSVLAVILGIILSFAVFFSIFLIDLKLKLSPFADFAMGRFKFVDVFDIMEKSHDVWFFAYLPLTSIIIGIIVSFIAKIRRWLCSVLAMLPIFSFFYIGDVQISDPMLIFKSTFSVITCLGLAGLIGVVIQRIKT